MYIRSGALCEELKQYEKIIIYGAGHFAKEIYPQLVRHGLKKKIACFTQTEGREPVSIDGIPVVNIKELQYNMADCVILIAVSKLYVDEIKQILAVYGYPNIAVMIDYRIDYKFLESDYRYLTTFEEYCEYIADWNVRKRKDNQDIGMVIRELLRGKDRLAEKRDENLVVWICGHLSSRTVKIAGALKRKNYRIVFLSYFNSANPWNLDELRELDIQIYPCTYVAEMLYYALQFNPLVYFFEPGWGDCLWAEIMLKKKQYFGKTVIALYDVMNDGYTGKTEKELVTEKYALEHADGIVWRWFSKDYLEDKGFRYQGKSIQFPDYCNHEKGEVIVNDSEPSVVKICFISGYGDEYVEDRKHPTKYTDWARIGEILEKIGNRNDCIFHFYVGELQNYENVLRCAQYEKRYKNFKFFLATEHGELLKKFKDYDYGCELWISGEDPPDDMPMGDYYGSIYHNSVRNAYFDFLSAGLSVITTQASKMREFLSADDVIINMTLDNLDIDYLREYKQYYKTKVMERRKEWDIDNQVVRLLQFFKDI